MTIMWSTMLVPASLRDPADRLQFGMSDFLRRNRQPGPLLGNSGPKVDAFGYNKNSRMSIDVVRRDELRPGIPRICEVGDVEGEVNRLSRSGWIAVLWPRVPPPSEALDLLLLAVGKATREHSYKHTPR